MVYLSFCPTKAEIFLETLLTSLSLDSDKKVLEVANILKSAELDKGANCVYVRRGMYWWKKSLLNHRMFGPSSVSNQTGQINWIMRCIYIL